MTKPKLGSVAALIAVLIASAGIGILPVAAAPTITRSAPESGSSVDDVPKFVELWTSEPVDRSQSQIIVVAPNGARVDSGTIEFDDADELRLVASIPNGGSAGHYTVHLLTGEPNTSSERSSSIAFEVSGEGSCKHGSSDPAVGQGCLDALPEALPDQPVVLADGSTVAVALSSSVAGPVDISVTVLAPNGDPAELARVWIRPAHLEMDHGEFPHEAVMDEPGVYAARYVGMGMEGSWSIAVDLLLSTDSSPITFVVPVEMQTPG